MFKELFWIKKIITYNTFVCYCLITIFNHFSLALTDQQCMNQGNCNNGNDINCGICINSDKHGTGKCIFPFPYMFLEGIECSVSTTCEEGCSSHGVCSILLSDYIPSCSCNIGFYGRKCEYSVPKDLIKQFFPSISIQFRGIQDVYKLNYRRIRLHCFQDISDLKAFEEIEIESFYYRAILDLTSCKTFDYRDITVASRFPYKPLDSEANNKILLFGNEVLGYLSEFGYKLTVNGIINYQNNISVFVSYQKASLICVPVISLSGCALKKENKNIYSKSNHIKISSNVVYLADGRYVSKSLKKSDCEDNANYHWKMWNHYDYHRDDANFEYFDLKDLSFDPYSLDFKYYKIYLEVTSMQEEPSQNFAFCYFSIKFTPLVAVIDGGSERTVTKRYGIILSTSISHDPNMPPDKQEHMKASWSCVDVSKSKAEICDPSLTLPVTNNYIVPSDKLSYGAVYNITLKVWTNYYDDCTECDSTVAFDFARITISNKTDEGEDYIYIQCLMNCQKKVIHNQQLYLRVKTGVKSKQNGYQFKWTYYEKGQSTEKDTKNITVDGLPSFMFLLKENALSSGKSYIIVVRVLNKQWLAKYAFQTYEAEFNGDCSVKPNTGIKGLSLFEIQCQNFSGSPIYEFYDKTKEEAQSGTIFNGRMLGTSGQSNVGELKHFRVTRGQVLVYIIDKSGLYTQKQFSVDLLPWNVTEEIMGQIFFNLTELLNQGESEKMLEYISSVPDITPSEMDKHEILNKLLYLITLVSTDTLADMKLTTSTLTNVLLNLNKPVQLAIEPELMKDTLHIVRNQTFILSGIVREGTDLKGMSPQEIRLVATYQLDCLHAALMCKDPRTVGITEFDYDLKTLDDLMDTSNFAEEAIYLIKDILTFLQTPGQPPTQISATGNSYILWVVENDEEYNLTNYLSQIEEIPVVVSNELIKEFEPDLRKSDQELAVRVAALDDNIFWWSKSNIKSSLVSVSLAAKHSKSNRLGRIKFVQNHIGMQISLTLGLNSTQIKGRANPYNNSKTGCTLEKDLIIDIYRLDPEPQSLLLLTFLFPQTNGSLLVHVQMDLRPDCFMMMKHAITINETSPTYNRPVISNREEPTFYYVGIIPEGNTSVTYTFEVNTTVCQYWAKGHWSSEGCKISSTITDLKARCNCNHFSIFGAAFPVPPQEIDLFSDINLFLTVFDNPLVVSFVSILLILYLLCCLWACYKDKKDRPLKNVIFLDDNFPEDSFPYLLAIYTSSRFNAGTTAHVGIMIRGSLGASRAHILSSKDRKVLKRNYDDWFLMYCPESLGDLQSIHLWHDNSGSSPDWFCDKVIVYDLKDSTEIVFVVEQWIALRLTYFPEATVTGASVSQVKSVKRIFLDNCILGLRESHTLLCIILRHPRSEISRLQRISVLMCCLMSSMLCSIMFYSPQVDNHEYSVGLRDFYISIQSLVISLITTFLVLFAFKKTYQYKQIKKKNSTLQYRSSGYKEFEVSNISEKSAYLNFVRFVSKTMKGNPLIPAQLEHSEPVVVVRKTWRLIAWVLCIGVIITCSFFIMLYGLKLGLIKSKIWLSSVLFTLSEDFFVSTPARIIFLSIVLSIAFQRLCEIDNHRVETKDILSVKPQANEEQIEKLLVKRRHQMYAPLRADFKNEMLRKKELWNNWWTLIDFTVALCFIFVVSMVVFELWSSHYYNNSQLKKITTEPRGSECFFNFKNQSQVNTFLERSILRTLYITFWYNENPISEKGVEREYWAEDFTHTMVGHQRYRQIRISPVTCKFTFINTTRKCLPHYNSATEDKSDYSLRWKPAQWHGKKLSNSAWKYTDISKSSFSTLYRLRGKSGTIFHNGGYLADLGPTQVAFSENAEIVSKGWQDQLTRAVFVEFTLYNINVNLFSQVTMIVEYLISGRIQLKAQVVSVESRMKLSFWNTLFVAFVVYYVFRSGYLINRLGLFEYLSTSSRNRSRLIIVFLGALSILVSSVHFYSSTTYYKVFINRGYGDTYFDFDRFVYYFIQLRFIVSFLLAVAIFRTILIFRGGRTLLNYFYTFTISLRWIIWLTAVICTFLLVQVPLVILLNIFSFYSIKEIVMNLKFTQYFKSQSAELKYLQVFLFVKCIGVNFLLSFYILIFLHYFRIARTYKMKSSDKFNLITFLLDHMKIAKKTK